MTIARRRTMVYLAAFVGLAAGSLLLRDLRWTGTDDSHTLLETMAALVAFMVGALALTRYYSKKENAFLLIGAAFVGTGCLDGYHAVATSPWLADASPSPLTALIPWSWLASRLFLSLMLWLSWLAWTREARLGEAGLIDERGIYLGVGAVTLASVLFFAVVPTPSAYAEWWGLSRPQELVPAAFFLMALVGYLRKGEWRHNAYEHWLILSLLVGTMGQAAIMPTSHRLYDAPFIVNHLLKLLSYLCVLVGLTANASEWFRRAETSAQEARRATDALREAHSQLDGRVRQRTEELQRLNDALQESEQRFRMLADSAPVMIWMSDTEKRCVYLNHVWLEFTGRALGQDLGHGWVEHVHPDDRAQYVETFDAAFDARQSFVMDYRLRRHDGEYRWVLDKGVPRFTGDGQFAGFIGTCTDITERKRAEDALQAHELRLTQQLSALVGLMGSDALRANDVTAALQHVTETDARTLGVERVSVWRYNHDRTAIRCIELYETGTHRHSSGAQLDAAAYPSYFRALNETPVIAADDACRDPRTCEFSDTYLRPLGITSMLDAPIHVNGVLDGVLCHEHIGPVRQWTPDEKTLAMAVANIVSLVTEQGERKRAEESLRDSEARFRQVTEHIKEVFWLSGPEKNQILYVSAAYEEIWGRTCESLYGSPRSWLDAIHADDRPRVLHAALTQQIAGQYDEEYRIVRPDGSVRWIRDRAFPIRDASRRVYRIAGLAEDITERKRTAETLTLFRSLIDHTNDAIEVIDPETGRFLDVNEHACLAHGYSREEYLALTVPEVDPLVAARGWEKTMEENRRSGSRIFESQHRRKDGTVFPVEVNVTYIPLDRDYLLAVVRDITERKRAEEALTMHSRVLESMAEGVSLSDEQGFIRYTNPAEDAMFGYRPGELIGRHVTALNTYPPDENARIVGHVIAQLKAHGTWSGEFSNRKKDGTAFTTFAHITALEIANKTYWVCVQEDISQRKHAEEALRQSEARYKALVESAPVCIHEIDLQGRLASMNQAGIRMMGAAHEADVCGLAYLDVVAPEDRERIGRLLARAKAGEPSEFEFSAGTEQGLRHFASGFIPLKDADGTVVKLMGITRDITDQRRAEDRLRQSEERYRGLVDTMQEGLGVQDKQGLITYVNQRLCEMVGYAREELLGKPAACLFDEENRKILRDQMERRRRGERQSFEIAWRRKDGSKVDTIIAPCPRFDAEGNFVESAAVITDITERKRLEEALRQAQKMEAVGRLAGGIAHDFNNLLTIILGQSHRLLKQLTPRHPMQRILEEIKHAGERAASLTTQLLAFSRKQVLQPKTLALNDLVTNMEELLRRLIGEHMTLTMRLDPALGHVKADPGQLEQVVMNLVLNARDAMPRGGTITLATKLLDIQETDAAAQAPPGRYASLVVNDTGQGMDADTQARIFEPFFTTKVLGRGTGLGLSMVYGIVAQSGGFISVLSQSGCGATFTICLPQVEETKEPEAVPPVAPAPPGSGETILLVEDEPEVREFVRDMLEEAGYGVLAARDGVEALALAEQHPAFALLLTDVVMPRLGGRELAERLAARRPSLRVLYMSGYTDDVLLPHGVPAFIQKPFSAADLLKKIRTSLEQTR